MPQHWFAHAALAAAYGQLGRTDAAARAVQDLLRVRPDFAATARSIASMWWEPEHVERLVAGWRKAGLTLGTANAGHEGPVVPMPKDRAPSAVAIAVLPFSDMSPARDQEYLCEGMAEEIMNALVRINGIRVASRTSTFRARQDNSDLPAIARALCVTHVLEGSVRTSGTKLRVTAQLTDIATGYHLWSERFDREATDVFAVQDEISVGVVEAVRARLASGASIVHVRPPARNLDAYRSYLKGRHLRGKEHHAGAMAAYEDALRLDPSHAASWTGLAECMVLSAHFNVLPARETCASARKAVANAVELEGESANTLHVEAFVAMIERRWQDMETAWRRAIDLQPTHVLALGSFGIALCMRERFDEGFALLARAREADPLASFPCMLTGFGLLDCGRVAEAQRYFEDALAFEKEDVAALYLSGAALVALGRTGEGIATLRHVVDITGRAGHFVGLLGWALATAGRKDEGRALLDELRARPNDAPTLTAESWLLGALGETDAAFDVIDRAMDEYQANLYYTGFPGFDALRADPRFAALRERLGLGPKRPA
jgi:serine/threonine-protein kinase